MEKITRTVTATTVQYAEAIAENGVPAFRPCGDEVIPGEITDQVKALQYLRKKYGVDRSFVVTGMTTDTKKYEMDLATFIATATPVATVAKQDISADNAADAETTSTGMGDETGSLAAPVANGMASPSGTPSPSGQVGAFLGSLVTSPAEAAPSGGSDSEAVTNTAPISGSYPGFSSPQ